MYKINDVIIRLERPVEQRAVENLVRESFWNVYRPGALEHYVLHLLRDYDRFVPELNLVMEKDGRLIGQAVSVRTEIKLDGGGSLPILLLGPICIANDCKHQGYGKLLLDYWLECATKLDFGAVCLEGAIGFYGKSGFCRASRYGLRYHGMPEDMEAEFFLARELKPGYLDGVTGEYVTPEIYMVEEKLVEEFDTGFAPKIKLKLPGQLG